MYLATYIKSSITIIKTHTIVLLITAIVSGINTANFLLSYLKHNSMLNIPAMVVTFVTTLVMYGLYYEIIENKYTSMREIFTKYVYGYFVVTLIIALPIMMLSLFLSLPTSGNTYQSIQKIGTILVLVVFMYVVPYFFHTNKIVESFKCGLGFLVNNFHKSLSLIVAVVLFYAVKIILGIKLVSLASESAYIYAFAQYIYMFSYFTFDYMLFIVLVLAITDKEKKV